MAGNEETESGGPPDAPRAGAKRAEREARLAEQLRANLLRRKQQARQRQASEPAPSSEESS